MDFIKVLNNKIKLQSQFGKIEKSTQERDLNC